MIAEAITVTIKLFAAYQEAYGIPELEMELPQDARVEMVGDRIRAQHPELQSLQAITRYGVNLEFVPPETLLQDGDEVVLIPPVSGG